MKSLPKISDTEWEIMRVVWSKHPITAAEVIESLVAEDPSWHPKTARTLLARLVKKKALDYEPRGRSYVYEPRLREADCVEAASRSFLERVFGGALISEAACYFQSTRPKEAVKPLEALLRLDGTPKQWVTQGKQLLEQAKKVQ
jgi:BlaI family penicillinase repressor